MALFKKKKSVAPEEIDLESIDRESKYKIFSEKGDKIIKVVLTLWALFQLYASISNKVPLQILRYARLGLAITWHCARAAGLLARCWSADRDHCLLLLCLRYGRQLSARLFAAPRFLAQAHHHAPVHHYRGRDR